MKHETVQNIFTGKWRWFWHVLYWLMAALVLLVIFSNRNYDIQIRIILVAAMIVVSYSLTWLINYVLIPKFLYKNKIATFIYLVFFGIIFTMWINFFAAFVILAYSAFKLPEMIIPTGQDILILIIGNYLVVILAVVIHFIRESYQRLAEKNELEKQNLQAESKLKDAQMKLLQGQIHPHFLFNMLNNLYGLVKKDTEIARNSILKLSELLDYMLYKGESDLVKLSDEIKFINNYIALEKIRRRSDFKIQFDYPEDTDNYRVPPLLLFPLVENAFKHGSSGIRLSLKIEEKEIIFRSQNPFSTKQKDKYLQSESSGIGLKNIRERLNIMYPGNHTFEISDKDNIFTVELKIKSIHE